MSNYDLHMVVKEVFGQHMNKSSIDRWFASKIRPNYFFVGQHQTSSRLWHSQLYTPIKLKPWCTAILRSSKLCHKPNSLTWCLLDSYRRHVKKTSIWSRVFRAWLNGTCSIFKSWYCTMFKGVSRQCHDWLYDNHYRYITSVSSLI